MGNGLGTVTVSLCSQIKYLEYDNIIYIFKINGNVYVLIVYNIILYKNEKKKMMNTFKS